jgi:hypothetical protein
MTTTPAPRAAASACEAKYQPARDHGRRDDCPGDTPMLTLPRASVFDHTRLNVAVLG